MSTFNEKREAAELAILKKRGGLGSLKGLDKKAVKGKAMSDGVIINGVEVPSKEWVEDANRELRDDLNGVIETLDLDGPRVTELRVVDQNDDLIGSLEGVVHEMMPQLVKAASVRNQSGLRKNIMLTGPTGGGKTTAGKKLAEVLGLSFDYIGQTEMPHDVVGSVGPVDGKYRSTAFVNAFLKGGVVMLEEMDAWSPRATLVTNPPLANDYITLPDGTHHERHADCVVIACMNTWGLGATMDYVGRNRLDAAYLDRFAIKISWEYDEGMERKAVGNNEVVDVVQAARYNAKHHGIKVIISPRSSFDIADMVRAGFSIREACGMNFLAGCDPSQRERLWDDIDV